MILEDVIIKSTSSNGNTNINGHYGNAAASLNLGGSTQRCSVVWLPPVFLHLPKVPAFQRAFGTQKGNKSDDDDDDDVVVLAHPDPITASFRNSHPPQRPPTSTLLQQLLLSSSSQQSSSADTTAATRAAPRLALDLPGLLAHRTDDHIQGDDLRDTYDSPDAVSRDALRPRLPSAWSEILSVINGARKFLETGQVVVASSSSSSTSATTPTPLPLRVPIPASSLTAAPPTGVAPKPKLFVMFDVSPQVRRACCVFFRAS